MIETNRGTLMYMYFILFYRSVHVLYTGICVRILTRMIKMLYTKYVGLLTHIDITGPPTRDQS